MLCSERDITSVFSKIKKQSAKVSAIVNKTKEDTDDSKENAKEKKGEVAIIKET